MNRWIPSICLTLWATSASIAYASGSDMMLLIAVFAFLQNVSFTFVSRGRNSGSLTYHMIAAIFSNGMYAALLFMSIDLLANAQARPMTFLTCYTMATLGGSIFAHWLAMRIERGKARNVQEDRVEKLEKRIWDLETTVGPVGEQLDSSGRSYKEWKDDIEKGAEPW